MCSRAYSRPACRFVYLEEDCALSRRNFAAVVRQFFLLRSHESGYIPGLLRRQPGAELALTDVSCNGIPHVRVCARARACRHAREVYLCGRLCVRARLCGCVRLRASACAWLTVACNRRRRGSCPPLALGGRA